MPRRGITLSEEQWHNVKALAAKRGQTISAWFGDVIMEMGIGRATGKEYPGPSERTPDIVEIAERARANAEEQQAGLNAILERGVAAGFDPVAGRKAQQAERDRIPATDTSEGP